MAILYNLLQTDLPMVGFVAYLRAHVIQCTIL
jgi:hypothetical protein